MEAENSTKDSVLISPKGNCLNKNSKICVTWFSYNSLYNDDLISQRKYLFLNFEAVYSIATTDNFS